MSLRRLGYPCIRVSGSEQTVKRCQLANATDERLKELIDRNLSKLMDVLEYNISHDIRFFRIHSDTVPFASHPDVDFDWPSYARDQLAEVGEFISDQNIRISMHPGQYTVLNSPDDGVVNNARRNLRYHSRFLDLMNLGPDAKIVVHIGGEYGDRETALDRFIEKANDLSDPIRERLVIENDETSYDIDHVLSIHRETDLPVIFDHLHHRLNEPEPDRDVDEWIKSTNGTWDPEDGPPILHFSSLGTESKGHHARRIKPGRFEDFLDRTRDLDPFDVMLECKDKEDALREVTETVDWPFEEYGDSDHE